MALPPACSSPATPSSSRSYCCLTAFVRQARRSGDPAPAAYYAEQRRQAEMFGLGGARSQHLVSNPVTKRNAFARSGRR